MKRMTLLLLGGLLFNTLAAAQMTEFSQRGIASRVLSAEGLYITHPLLPLDSKAIVVNTLTGKEIEVTVIGRMPLSPYWIADLSPGVWQELGLGPNTEIRIYTPSPQPSPPPYNGSPAPPLSLVPLQAQEIQPELFYDPYPQLIPGLPDPGNGKIYRLQVGAFSKTEAATNLAYEVQALGYDVVLEQYNQVFRVLVVGIPSAYVFSVAQRLGENGIAQIWVRE